jgi:hypothetical protein
MTSRLQSSILPLLLLAGLLAPCARGAEPDDKRPLQLTAEIVGSRYCAGDRLDILQLSVRLRYRNVGAEKVIVYPGKNLLPRVR